MNIITAILEIDADGTLHLPLPAEFSHGKVEVTATLRLANGTSCTIPQAEPDQVAQRKIALLELRNWAD